MAYFLGGSLPIDQRRHAERRLVERYRQALAAAGVAVPSEDELFESYRRTMLYTLGVVALLMGQLDFTVNERAGDLARTIVERFYTAGADLGLGDVAAG